MAIAVLGSAGIHAAVLMGLPPRIAAIDDTTAAIYSASIDPMAAMVTTAEPAPVPAPGTARARPRRAPSSLPKSRIAPPPAPPERAPPEPAPPEPVAVAKAPPPPPAKPPEPEPLPPEPPEQLALAQPAVPVKALEPEKFPVDALPANLTIDYQLTSAFADGRASYHWDRDGDTYNIRGEAEAEGFFTLFLEGRIVQETSGTMTATGLRPERFRENKPGGAPEGLEFDWNGKQVTFDRHGEKKTTPLTDNTVDWLSMIFQLAHLPPKTESVSLQVFTQRRMYRFQLNVIGMEEIEIPLGRVRALHLRHADEGRKETVDVWLGVDQYYLPVKMRFPAARNRITVEQVATRVTTR
ncbi:MAG TPA: DUF3108 domain-containing protein [Usitatibacter sp.]|nr:DUF3108 domain-containing protein [Usitatibacter sp.]